MMLFNDPNWCDDLYDSDQEIDTDFYTKSDLEEFKIVKDLSAEHLNIELPEKRKEDHT